MQGCFLKVIRTWCVDKNTGMCIKDEGFLLRHILCIGNKRSDTRSTKRSITVYSGNARTENAMCKRLLVFGLVAIGIAGSLLHAGRNVTIHIQGGAGPGSTVYVRGVDRPNFTPCP